MGHICLDVETQRWAREVGGWIPERMGLAVAVTWDADQGFRDWFEDDVHALIQELAGFDRVVGFNILDFDYRVLAAYDPHVSQLLAPKTLDMLADVHRALGFRVSLGDLARATLGRGKTGTGEDALRWWREGKRDLVIKYCRDDVEITRQLYEYGGTHGVIYYPRHGARCELAVDWEE